MNRTKTFLTEFFGLKKFNTLCGDMKDEAFAGVEEKIVSIIVTITKNYFDTLPNEVLKVILGYVEVNSEWISVMLTCKRFASMSRIVFDPSIHGNNALVNVCRRGKYKFIEPLLKDKRIDPTYSNNLALMTAIKKGYHYLVRLLLDDPRIDPALNDNLALHTAIVQGHPIIVAVLLEDKRVDPTYQGGLALISAHALERYDILRLLIANDRMYPPECPQEVKLACQELDFSKALIMDLIPKERDSSLWKFRNSTIRNRARATHDDYARIAMLIVKYAQKSKAYDMSNAEMMY